METSITIKKNYFTSIEQSSKLYKLGLDSKTADMAYVIRRDDCRVPWEKAAEDEKKTFSCICGNVHHLICQIMYCRVGLWELCLN